MTIVMFLLTSNMTHVILVAGLPMDICGMNYKGLFRPPLNSGPWGAVSVQVLRELTGTGNMGKVIPDTAASGNSVHAKRSLHRGLGVFLCLGLGLTSFKAQSQHFFEASGQVMQRAEFRNGYGQLISGDQDPVFFVGQRARINASYDYKNIRSYVSAQDVRIWGGAAHTKLTDNFLSIYEAYLEAGLSEYWKVKLGRQELHYDNVRFLGNLDWALQGRSHDAALVQYEKNKFKLHIAAAYNQAGQSLTAVPFLVPNHYKTAQMLHLENKSESFDWSFLMWNQGAEQQILDANAGIIDWHTRFSQTIGLPVLRYRLQDFTVFGFYYHQLGRDVLNRKVNAFDASAQISWKRNLNKENRHFQMTLGGEYLSGNSRPSDNQTQNAFNPYYGTNHAHNGYMDYFFVGGRNNAGLGLVDRFLRLKYQASEDHFWSLNTHWFSSAGQYELPDAGVSDKNLGLELDLSTGYVFNDALSVQVGYSQFFASGTLENIQNVENAQSFQNWAYVMLLFRPDSKNRFVGLFF